MSAPTSLDALKYVSLQGIDLLDHIAEELVINRDLDDNDPIIGMIDTVIGSMHRALRSQVPYRLATPLREGGEPMPHSNTYDQARFYSDGSPVYSDEPCAVPTQGEDGMTHLVASQRRVFKPLPGVAA